MLPLRDNRRRRFRSVVSTSPTMAALIGPAARTLRNTEPVTPRSAVSRRLPALPALRALCRPEARPKRQTRPTSPSMRPSIYPETPDPSIGPTRGSATPARNVLCLARLGTTYGPESVAGSCRSPLRSALATAHGTTALVTHCRRPDTDLHSSHVPSHRPQDRLRLQDPARVR